jgi:hypothetical protein
MHRVGEGDRRIGQKGKGFGIFDSWRIGRSPSNFCSCFQRVENMNESLMDMVLIKRAVSIKLLFMFSTR